MTCLYQREGSGDGQLDHREIEAFTFGHVESNHTVRHPGGNSLAPSLSF